VVAPKFPLSRVNKTGSMLRARLLLLKDLLAPTGSIYVHLDWHAVHYVKILLDELFGYSYLEAEIIWKRTSARSDTAGFNHSKRSGYPTRATVRNDGAVRVARYEEQASAR